MRVIVTLFIATITLIAGALAGYVYKAAETNDLAGQVSRLQTELARSEQDAASAARQAQSLNVELGARMKLADDQQAKIAELQTALQKATTPAQPPRPAAPTEPSQPAAASKTPKAPLIPPLPPARP
jgi:peptidoglycan hydrolase CwlO-like protein